MYKTSNSVRVEAIWCFLFLTVRNLQNFIDIYADALNQLAEADIKHDFVEVWLFFSGSKYSQLLRYSSLEQDVWLTSLLRELYALHAYRNQPSLRVLYKLQVVKLKQTLPKVSQELILLDAL